MGNPPALGLGRLHGLRLINRAILAPRVVVKDETRVRAIPLDCKARAALIRDAKEALPTCHGAKVDSHGRLTRGSRFKLHKAIKNAIDAPATLVSTICLNNPATRFGLHPPLQ
jgi:hypothetical protein